MVKKLFIYIFIYTLLVGCDRQDPTSSRTGTNYFLEVTAPSLELDVNGYYHMEWLEGYDQTFTTLDATTGSEDMYQKVMWNSDSGIEYNSEFVSCVNSASYTNSNGIAHTVLAAWEEHIGDTIMVYTWYADEFNNEYMDAIGVIVDNEI